MKSNNFSVRLALFSLVVIGVLGCSSQGVQPVTGSPSTNLAAEREEDLATTASEKTPASVAEPAGLESDKVEIEYDKFTKETHYKGADHVVGAVVDDNVRGAAIRLVATQNATETGYALNIWTSYVAKRYIDYSSAVDISGARWPVYANDRDVDCSGGACQFTEQVLIAVERKEIEARQDTGFHLRLEGARGRQELELPAAYVKSFLAKVPDGILK